MHGIILQWVLEIIIPVAFVLRDGEELPRVRAEVPGVEAALVGQAQAHREEFFIPFEYQRVHVGDDRRSVVPLALKTCTDDIIP